MIIIEPIKNHPGLFTASTYRHGSRLTWKTAEPAAYSSITKSIIEFIKDCGGTRIYVKDRATSQQYWLVRGYRGRAKKKMIKPFLQYKISKKKP